MNSEKRPGQGALQNNSLPSSVVEVGPFAEGALVYRRKGWLGLFPVGTKGDPYAKSPVPKGVTGYDGQDASFDKIRNTVSTPAGKRNLGLRMPRQVIALDVDEYEGHSGLETLEKAEVDLGPLPATYRNTARPGVSGHRFYRLPLGYVVRLGAEEILGKAYGENIEILHWGHRYAVVWPSLNPSAGLAPYRWYGPDGTELPEPPAVVELPILPDAWCTLLAAKEDSPEAARRSGGNMRAAKPRAEDEAFDMVGKAIRRSRAEQLVIEQVDGVLSMGWGSVNKRVGAAGIWLGKMAASGLMTLEQAARVLEAASLRHGVHSDAWNRANKRKWTLRSRMTDALSQGIGAEPYTLIEDVAPTNLHAQLMQRIAR